MDSGTSQCDVFMKIGGSILDQDALTAELVPHIAALASQYRIMILTGGGQVVKRIKAAQRKYGTDFKSCWIPAVLNLDVNAGILAAYSPRFKTVASAQDMSTCFEAGCVAVFAAANAVFNSLYLKPDFTATTDSMGLYFARTLGARRYVIVTDVDGIYADRPTGNTWGAPIPRITPEELSRLPSSKLDPTFPDYFRRFSIPTRVVNGRHPTRVAAAIRGEPFLGTEIAGSFE